MMAFLEFTFRSQPHFFGVCFLIVLIGSMAAFVTRAFRGPDL